MTRLRVEATGAGSRSDGPTDGRLQSGIRGLAPHDGAFRQDSITNWRSYLMSIPEPLDLLPPVRVAALRLPRGTLNQTLHSSAGFASLR
jgi:hypothetical protein